MPAIKTKIFRVYAASTAFLFALFCLCLTTGGPTFSSSSSASATSTDLSFTSEPVLSLNVSGDLNFSISSSDFNKFLSKNLVANAASNNETGYTLTLSNDDEDLDLHETSDATDQVISALTEPITITTGGSNFPANQWGYSLNSTDYTAIPANTSAAVLATPDVAGSTSSTINVATKVGDTFPGGTYQDTVVISLTAKPVTRIPKSLEKMTTLQQMAEYPELCTAAATGTTVTLEDTRDGNSYRIRKLADGNCWMIDDLHLADVEITSADSDISDATYTVPATTPGTETSGSSDTVAQIHTNEEGYENSLLYNWMAATAGTGTTSVSSGNASTSICPKGWKLPKGDTSDGSFYYLVNTGGYNTNTKLTETSSGTGPEFLYAGYWDSGLYNQGDLGYYWSRTANSSSNAYYLYFDIDGFVIPQSSSYKYLGSTIRCVAATPVSKLTYLQDIASADVDGMAIGETALLKDKRDEKQYRVRKLKDGKLWMIDNLRLGTAGTALTLTTADSNVSSTKTIPAAQIVNSGSTSWTSNYQSAYHIYNREDATFTETTDDKGVYYDVSGNDYGNLYNWYTATAGSGTTQSQGTEVSESICPKGWILPQNASGAGSFYTLYQSYNSQSLMTTVAAKNSTVADRGPEFKLAGNYGGGVSNEGSSGSYWSRTAYGKYGSYYFAYRLDLVTSSVTPQSNGHQYYGFSVRCIAS